MAAHPSTLNWEVTIRGGGYIVGGLTCGWEHIKCTEKNLMCWRRYITYNQLQEPEIQAIKDEYFVLCQVRHPNIMDHYWGTHYRLDKKFHMCREYDPRMKPLSYYISSYSENGVQLPESTIWKLISQLGSALYSCHYAPTLHADSSAITEDKNPVLHRDINPGNILCNGAEEVFRLTDFGLNSLHALFQASSTDAPSTYAYTAPEVRSGGAYTPESDIWSFGCVLYELCTLDIGCAQITSPEAWNESEFIQRGIPWPDTNTTSATLRGLVGSCMSVDPTGRPSIAEVMGLLCVRGFGSQLAGAGATVDMGQLGGLVVMLGEKEEELKKAQLDVAKGLSELKKSAKNAEEKKEEVKRMEKKLLGALLNTDG